MEDILSKVQEILDDPKKLEDFKSLASAFLGDQSSGKDQKNQEPNQEQKSEPEPSENKIDIENILRNFSNSQSGEGRNVSSDQIELPLNMDMILKIKDAMALMNRDDKNIAFLRSLRELLGNDKQTKIDDAIKIIRIIRLLPLVKDLKILKNLRII